MNSHPSTAAARRRAGCSPKERPEVIVNMAMTADGKIATARRGVTSFGSRHDHDRLLALRATADAVLCGASTAGGDNMTLGPGPLRYRQARLRRGLAEYNLRVVVSGSARLDPESSIFSHRFSPIIILTTQRAPRARRVRLERVADAVAAFGRRELDLASALAWLWKTWKVRRLICEGGGELNDAMFRAGLVDELRLTICPRLCGGGTAPTIADGTGCNPLSASHQLRLRSRRLIGSEMFLVYDAIRSD